MDIKSTCLLFSFAALLMVTFVSGNDCRTSRTVVESAQSVAANSAAGGHIWQHVRGLHARPEGAKKKETQLDKTLFASEHDYESAWQTFQSESFPYLTPYQCDGCPKGQAVDCVLARDINVRQAFRCTAVDKNTKLCIDDKPTHAVFVQFWYAKKRGEWVLNTAYPSGANTLTKACQKIPRAETEWSNQEKED